MENGTVWNAKRKYGRGERMNKLSFYLDKEVIIKLHNRLKVIGLLQHYKGAEYYIVLRDGSRCYFNKYEVESIQYR